MQRPFIVSRSRAFALAISSCVLAGALSGCTVATSSGDEPTPDVESEEGSLVLKDGDSLARPALRLVERAGDVNALGALGLAKSDAAAVLAHREGLDGVLGTVDDDPIQTIEELSVVLGSSTRRGSLRRLATAAGKASDATDEECSASSPRRAPLPVFATPQPADRRYLPITALVDAARATIEVTMYQLSSPVIIASLQAAARGVDVRVLVDRAQPENTPLVADLASRGIHAKLTSARFTYTHQKTMTVDHQRTLVFSGNFDRLSFESGRNYGTVTSDPEDVWDFVDLFEADWIDAPISIACTRLVLSPGSSPRIVEIIDSAKATLEMEALYASDNGVLSALERAHARGVTIRVVFNDPKFHVGDASDEAARLAKSQIPVKRLPKQFVHAKILVADGTGFFVGSENFSWGSLVKNREAGLRIDLDPVAQSTISSTFEADWAAGVDF